MSNYNKIATLKTGSYNPVKMITALRDGRLVSTSYQELKIWRKVDCQWVCEQTIEDDSGWIHEVIELSDGRIFSGGYKTIKIWKFEEAALICEHTLVGHTDYVMSIIQLRDGRLVSGSCDNTIKIWKKVNRKWVCEQTIEARVSSIIELRDGRIVSGGYDGMIKIWNKVDGKFEYEGLLDPKNYKVLTLLELSDERLVSGSCTNLDIWKRDGFEWICEHKLIGHTDCLYSIIELKDGRIVSASDDKTLKIWKFEEGNWLCEQTLLNDGYVFTAIAIKDGQFLICGSGSSINIWEIEKPIALFNSVEKISIGLGLMSEIKDDTITISRNNKTIATISMKLDVVIEGNKQDE